MAGRRPRGRPRLRRTGRDPEFSNAVIVTGEMEMNINFLPYFVIWVVLAIVVIGLYLYHRSIARQEDALLAGGVLEAPDVVRNQSALDQKLASVDRWGKLLTAVMVIYGLALAGLYLYQTWQQMSRIGV